MAFDELWYYLPQPVRTYSAGMRMRLAFSVATSIPADIHVIDEVLGVGDAYFFGKCLQRFVAFKRKVGPPSLCHMIMRPCFDCVLAVSGLIEDRSPPMARLSR